MKEERECIKGIIDYYTRLFLKSHQLDDNTQIYIIFNCYEDPVIPNTQKITIEINYDGISEYCELKYEYKVEYKLKNATFVSKPFSTDTKEDLLIKGLKGELEVVSDTRIKTAKLVYRNISYNEFLELL